MPDPMEAVRRLRAQHPTGTPSAVDGTPAGHAFCSAQTLIDDSGGDVLLWLPLLHGAERLGVLTVRAKAEPDDQSLRDLRVIT
jgi:phosphoserine phosphatase RsbU/P